MRSKPSRPRIEAVPASGPAARLAYRSFARSDVGRVRKGNEDAFFRDDALRLYVVADGMGGHAAGEVASAEAVDTVFGMVKRGLPALGDPEVALDEPRARAACRIVEGAIQAATYMVFAIGELDRKKSGMGTTISCALFVGGSIVVGQVGDSRVYRIRDLEAEQLTEDHTLIAWQMKRGLISEEEARVSPYKNVITRAVGSRDYVEVDTAVYDVAPADRFLLCSDGLHGYLNEVDLATLSELGGQQAVDALVDAANERGGRDNITAILVEVDPA